MKAANEENASSAVKTSRPPNRSVSMPIGSRANEPSSTGTATRSAVSDAVSLYRPVKTDASPPTRPHAANESANEIVARTSARVWDPAASVA